MTKRVERCKADIFLLEDVLYYKKERTQKFSIL